MDPGSGPDVVSKHSGPPDVNYLLRPGTAEITTTNGFQQLASPYNIPPNFNAHIAMVYDGQFLRHYVNGCLSTQVAQSGNMVQNPFRTFIGFIGCCSTQPGCCAAAGEQFLGLIDEVRIWNIARSQADLLAFMNTTLPNPATLPGLLAYYQFEGNYANVQGNPAWNGTPFGGASITTADVSPGPPLGTPTITPSAINVCPGQTVTLTANAVGATNYTWQPVNQPGQTVTAAVPGAVGTFDVTVVASNAVGCTSSATITLNVVQPQQVEVLGTGIACAGQSATLTASPGFASYVWSNNATGQVISVDQIGLYTVTATDVNGCTSQASWSVSGADGPQFNFIANNDAVFTGGNCFRLTQAINNQVGATWYAAPIDINQPFDYTYQLNFGNKDGSGADGIAFVFQSLGTTNQGSPGGGIGYSGIPLPYLAIEFDTYDNGAGANDIPCDHTMAVANGQISPPLGGPVQASATNCNIEDGQFHSVRIVWDPATNTISVFFDGNLRMQFVYDMRQLFGNGPLFWGFTASTGGSNNNQFVCMPPVPPAEYQPPVATLGQPLSCTSFAANWQPSAGAQRYFIDIATDPNFVNLVANNVDAGFLLAYNQFNLQSGATYYYRVRAQTPCGPTVPSNVVAVTLPSLQITPIITNVGCFSGLTGTVVANLSGGAGSAVTTLYTLTPGPAGVPTNTFTGLAAGSYTLSVSDDNGCVGSTNFVITQPPALSVFASGTNVSCFGLSNGTLAAVASGGTPPYSFAWSNGASGDQLQGVGPGGYTVTVTDGNGCQAASTPVNITQPTQLVLALDPVQILCNGAASGSIAALVNGGTPPYQYTWNTAQTTPNLTNLVPGFYELTVADANGCTALANATINEPPKLSLAFAPVFPSCKGFNNGSIDLTVGGGVPPYSYQWSNGFTGQDPSGLVAGTYSVLVTDLNGCTLGGTATLLEPDLLTATATQVNILCFGDQTGSIDVTVAGGTQPYTYFWDPGAQTTQDLTGLSAGTYSLVVSDDQACTATVVVTLTQPAAPLNLALTPTDISCFGAADGRILSQTTGGTPPYTYSWNGPSGFSNSLPGVTNLQPGAYTLVVTDANACTISAAVTLVQPAAVTIGFTTSNVCFPEPVAFFDVSSYAGTFTSAVWDFNDDGTPDFTSPGPSSPTFAYPVAGKYRARLTLTTDANCVYTYTQELVVYPKPVASFTAPPICFESPVVFNASTSSVQTSPALPNSIVSYAWDFQNDGVIDQTTIGPVVNHLYPTDGVFTARLVTTTNNGCRDTTIRSVTVYPIPVPQFTVLDTCLGFVTVFDALSTQLNAPGVVASYVWDFNGDNQSDATGAVVSHTYPVPGQYIPRLTVTTTDGCVRSVTDTVVIHPLPVPVVSTQSVCQGSPTVYTAALSSIATGSIVAYEWDFTDNGTVDTITALSGASIVYPDSGTYVCRLTTVSDKGCRTTTTVSTRVRPNPDASFSVDKPNACIGEIIQFQYTGIPLAGQLLNWDFGGGSVVSSLGQTYNVTFPSFTDSVGKYTVRLTAVSEGCTTVVSRDIQIFRLPIVDAGPDVAICKGERIELVGSVLNESGGVCQYLWVPLNASLGTIVAGQTSLTVQVAPEDTTDYQLMAICNGCVSNLDIARVYVSTPPVIILDSTEVSICKGSSGVALTNQVFGGKPGYAYYWSPPVGLDPTAAVPVALPTATTIYTVYVVDSLGCRSNEATIRVVVRPLPVADAGPDFAYCAGLQQGVFLNGSVLNPDPNSIASYTFEWFPKAGLSNPFIANPFASPDTTTIYTLIVRDKFGCTSEPTTLDPLSTAVVEVRPRPVADAGPDTVYRCQGQGVQLGGVPTGAGPEYSYFWTPADGLTDPATGLPSNTVARPIASPNVLSQTYFLIVSSNGCSSEPDFVTVLTQPKPTVFVEKFRLVCPEDSTSFAGVVSPVSGTYGFRWEPSEGLDNPETFLPKASPRVTTTYTLRYQYNGCTFSGDTVRVEVRPVPIVKANSDGRDRQLCPGTRERIDLSGLVDGGGEEVTFEWSPVVGFETGGQFTLNPLVRPTETTTYTLTARLASSGCSVRDSVTVFVLPGVVAKIVPSDTSICAGEPLLLRASGGQGGAQYVWRWIDSLGVSGTATGTELQARPKTTTRYVLEVVEGSCRSADTLVVRVGPEAFPAFAATSQRGCQGLTVLFENRSTGFDGGYTWDFGDGSIASNDPNPVHVYNSPGSYVTRLRIFTGQGCVYLSQPVVITVGGLDSADFTSQPLYPTDQVLDTALVIFRALDTDGAVSWLWSFGDGNSSTLRNPVHRYTSAGVYTVTLTVQDTVGCVYTVEHGPYVVRNPELDVVNVFTPDGDGVNDRWRPVYDGTHTYEAQVWDRWGLLLYSFRNDEPGWDGTLKGDPVPAGVYFYQVRIHNRLLQGHITLIR
jgi:gliding motility-associated-like protein